MFAWIHHRETKANNQGQYHLYHLCNVARESCPYKLDSGDELLYCIWILLEDNANKLRVQRVSKSSAITENKRSNGGTVLSLTKVGG